MKTRSSSKISTKEHRPPKEGDIVRMGVYLMDTHNSNPWYRYGLYLGKDKERPTCGCVMWFDGSVIGHGYSNHRLEIIQ